MSLVGNNVGRIRVQSLLGRGGMGEVYVGWDETLGRQVALKSILSKYALSKETKKRFLREARVLSQLDHPNICRIYDFIETEKGDFLVLELVEGRGLNVAIAEGLDFTEQLRIAEQIAQALVSAHAEGVVHRDLKPSNVVLTETGDVKVLDFGLARPMEVGSTEATTRSEIARRTLGPEDETYVEPLGSPSDHASGSSDDEETRGMGDLGDDEDLSIIPAPSQSASEHLFAGLHTKQGKVIGTPTYMSPEQARGAPITTASDMYSYGLLLQTLFSGKRPYPLELPRTQLLRRVRRAETLPLQGVDAEVTKLVDRLKSAAPSGRPTAATVVETLHWVRDRPRRRLRWLVAGVTLAVALAGGLKYAVDLSRERSVAVAARQEADRRRAQAEDLIGFMVGDLRDKLSPLGRLDILDDVGEKALAYFATLDTDTLADDELSRYSNVLTQIADVRTAQGALEEARAILDEAHSLAFDLVARDPSNGERQYALAQVLFWLANSDRLGGDLESAGARFSQYLEIAERLVLLDPERADWQMELAYAHSNLGTLLMDRKEYSAALEHFGAAATRCQSLLELDGSNVQARAALAEALSWLGSVQLSRGNLAAARELHSANLEQLATLRVLDSENAHWRFLRGLGLNHAGVVAELLGRFAEAEVRYEESLRIQAGLYQSDPTNRDWAVEVAWSGVLLGGVRIELGDPQAALARLAPAVEIADELLDVDARNVLWARVGAMGHVSAGNAFLALGRVEEASKEAQAAMRILDRALPEEGASALALLARGKTLVLRGLTFSRIGQADRARESWETAAGLLGSLSNESRPDVLASLARALLLLDRADEAMPLLDRLSESGYESESLSSLAADKGAGI